nr:PepSY domain-containing protein [Cupriavidus pampae]
MSSDIPATLASSTTSSSAYRMLWRWHFYAGLFVMPFLIVLAITGTIYCFQPQIEPLLYPQLLRVEPAGQRLPAQTLLERARSHAPAGAVATTYTVNDNPRASAEFVFRMGPGQSESVYLNPYTGERLGTLSVEDRLMKQVRMLHRALLVGKPGELLMELAGCWVLVMLATGTAMWWPRWRASGAAALKMGQAAGKRGWWKELHIVLGAWLAIGALAFVLSGLPWTASWGQQFKALATKANLGRPATGGGHDGHAAAPAAQAGAPAQQGNHAGHMDHAAHTGGSAAGTGTGHAGHTMESLPFSEVPWATGLTAVPNGSGQPATLTLDQVTQIAAARGAGSGCQVALPTKPDAVYTVSCFPADPKAERTLHIDPHDGRVVRDISYDDYGAVARAVSYGTSLHMGRYFGMANQIICAAISLGLMTLAISGFVMWWKRRPARALAAPKHPAAIPPMRAWVIGLGVLGAIFPMMGATMLAVWVLDRGVVWRQARRAAI